MNFKTTLIAFSLIYALFPTSVNAFPWNSQRVKKAFTQRVEKTKKTNNLSFLTSFKPPNTSQPKYTVGGATRGDSCAIDKENKSDFKALVPQKDQSTTLQSHPTFFAYISPMNGEKSAMLIVKDETEDYYHSQQLTLPASGGIVKMALAEDAPELEVDQSYTWFLRIQCNANLQPDDPHISGSVTRVAGNTPEMSQKDLVLFYANSKIWYESLNTAFELSQSGEDTYWSQLLGNIGMDQFAAKTKSDS